MRPAVQRFLHGATHLASTALPTVSTSPSTEARTPASSRSAPSGRRRARAPTSSYPISKMHTLSLPLEQAEHAIHMLPATWRG
jgi:hypothetical protein